MDSEAMHRITVVKFSITMYCLNKSIKTVHIVLNSEFNINNSEEVFITFLS